MGVFFFWLPLEARLAGRRAADGRADFFADFLTDFFADPRVAPDLRLEDFLALRREDFFAPPFFRELFLAAMNGSCL